MATRTETAARLREHDGGHVAAMSGDSRLAIVARQSVVSRTTVGACLARRTGVAEVAF